MNYWFNLPVMLHHRAEQHLLVMDILHSIKYLSSWAISTWSYQHIALHSLCFWIFLNSVMLLNLNSNRRDTSRWEIRRGVEINCERNGIRIRSIRRPIINKANENWFKKYVDCTNFIQSWHKSISHIHWNMHMVKTNIIQLNWCSRQTDPNFSWGLFTIYTKVCLHTFLKLDRADLNT